MRRPAVLGRLRLLAVAWPRRLQRAELAWRRRGFASGGIVTLDVFDTALRRSVAKPEDVFLLAAWRLRARGHPIDCEAFSADRIAAETTARHAAAAQGRHEVTLDEIYAHLTVHAAHAGALRDEELATERDVLHADVEILTLYRALLARGCRIVFISDNYLAAETLDSLLRGCGYNGTHDVVSSADHGVSKASGGLFRVVAAALAVTGDRIWHIGDNARADVLRARQAGWHALWYAPPRARAQPAPATEDAGTHLSRSLIAGIARLAPAPAARTGGAALNAIGPRVAGPLYLGFTLWLIDELRKAPCDRVLFCARDGRIMQSVYHRVLAAGPGGGASMPPDNYLMVSRRALVFPLLDSIDDAALAFLCGQFAALTVAEILERIGLVPELHLAALREHGLDPDQRVSDARALTAVHEFLRSQAHTILDLAQRERSLLRQYFDQEGCGTPQRLAIVDVGWKGSLQVAASKLLGPGFSFSGFYFGTRTEIRDLPPGSGTAKGWFVDADQPESRAAVTHWHWAVMELLFTAPHGSVLGYRRTEVGVAPILQALEAAAYEAAAGTIQSAALQFVDSYLVAFGGASPPPIPPEQLQPDLERLLLRPTQDEAKAIGNLFHVDGFGATRTGQFIAKPPRFTEWLATPLRAAGSYRAASWRRGFLIRLCGGWTMTRLALAAIRLVRPAFKGI